MNYPNTFHFRKGISQTIAFNPIFLSNNNKNHINISLPNNKLAIQQKKKPKYCKHHKWTISEDIILCRLIKEHGENDWNIISEKMDGRNSRQCKDRWNNYLNPNLNIGNWTQEEDDLILKKREELGPKWKIIATFFNNRTDSMIKTRYNALIRAKIKKNTESLANFMLNQSKQYKKNKKSKLTNDSKTIDNKIWDSMDLLSNDLINDDDFFNYFDE